MRRTFQIALLVVAFLPFALGTTTLLAGGARFLPEELVTPQLDSQLRFYSIFSLLPFLIATWIVRNLDSASSILAIVMCATAAAGAARLLSAAQLGVMEPAMIGAVVIEIGVLGFIPWHRAVLARSESAAARG